VIPATHASNTQGVLFVVSSAWLTRTDAPAMTVSNRLTAEAFFNVAAFVSGKNTSIVGQWYSDTSQRSWLLSMRDSGKLRFSSSSNGVDQVTKDSSLTVLTNVDYYAAAIYTAGSATFYLKDLRNPTNPVQSSTVTGLATSLHDSTAQLWLGAYKESGSYFFKGVMDEVRVSNTALTKGELLISPPPAGTVVVLR
jgi:hypothetical protein